ncbi:MAG: 50S ribosomal protein L9 [bacterium]
MEIILTEDVRNLGLEGELVEVADGYARNYLFPNQLAVTANESNKKQYKIEQDQIQQRREKQVEVAREMSDDLDGLSLTLEKSASEEGNLYGSVNQSDVAEAVRNNGFDEIDDRQVIIDNPIRELGEYTVRVNFVEDLEAEVRIEVVPG